MQTRDVSVFSEVGVQNNRSLAARINQLHAGTAQFSRSWLAFCSIRTLRNMVVYGGPSGRRAVDIATTKALQQILPNVEGIVRGEHGNTKAQKVRTWIEETWSKSK